MIADCVRDSMQQHGSLLALFLLSEIIWQRINPLWINKDDNNIPVDRTTRSKEWNP